MAQLDDLKAALAQEDADIDQVVAIVKSSLTEITSLQSQLAAAIQQSAPDLSTQIADIQARTTELASVLPAQPTTPTTK